jgi:hypothetical protein
MCQLLRSGSTARLGGGSPSTRRLIISAIMKMVAQYGSCPATAAKVIDDYTMSSDPDAQKRCLEFQTILTHSPQLLVEVFPVDASLEDVEVDINLSFLDGLVSEAISNGARPYQKQEDDEDDYTNAIVSQTASAFKMTPYEKPSEKAYGQGAMHGMGSSTMGPGGLANVALPPGNSSATVNIPSMNSPTNQLANPGEPQLVLRNVANVWGKQSTPVVVQPAAPYPSSNTTFTNTNTAAAPVGYGGFVTSTPASAPAVVPIKTAEQLEKERMAAALFGGISGAPPPPPPPPAPTRASTTATQQLPPSTVSGQVEPVAPVSAPPEVDLLGFDMESSTTTTSLNSVDMFAPMPMIDESSHAPPVATPSSKPIVPPPHPPHLPIPVSCSTYESMFSMSFRTRS